MKKSIISAMVILAAASLCWAAPKSDKSSGGKLKMDSSLFKTDAEFMQTFRNFSDTEVPAYAKGKVEEKERNLAVLAALLGVQGKEEFEVVLDKAQGFLVEIMLPQSVSKIGKEAFSYSDLSKITIPDSVAEIGENAFDTCSKLESVKIGSKVVKIGDFAFEGCTSLTSVEIPDSVISVGEQIFGGCESLKDVTLGKGLASISSNMFIDCSALEKIEIPDGVKSIERLAFYSCEKLESITIPASVTLIEESAFNYCTSLADVYYGGTVAEWNALKDDGKFNNEDGGNDALFNATIHCIDDDITPATGA